MAPIKFTVFGDPKAQKRHRTVRRGKFSQEYDPCENEKRNFLLTVQQIAPPQPIDEPVQLQLFFYLPRPKGHYGTGRNAGQLKESAPLWAGKRPDLDNLTKWILDALNGVFWRDDSIICSLAVMKQYDGKPRTEIVVETLSSLNEGETK